MEASLETIALEALKVTEQVVKRLGLEGDQKVRGDIFSQLFNAAYYGPRNANNSMKETDTNAESTDR